MKEEKQMGEVPTGGGSNIQVRKDTDNDNSGESFFKSPEYFWALLQLKERLDVW